jgi:hypothetical protein
MRKAGAIAPAFFVTSASDQVGAAKFAHVKQGQGIALAKK